MECYGKMYEKLAECDKCKQKKWCAEAEDPEMLLQKMVSLSENSDWLDTELPTVSPTINDNAATAKIYSQEDLYDVISFFLVLDWQTIEMLEEKLYHPEIKFTDMSRPRKITKQAIHKFIKSRCEMFPELEPFLRNRKNRSNKNQQETFMEAVCQIKRNSYETKSKKPESVSPSSRSLSSLSQNLPLSRLSISSGAGFSN